MEFDSFEDSDVEYRSSTPIFTSDDEQYPPALISSTKPPTTSLALRLSFSHHAAPDARYIFASSSSKRALGQRRQRRLENDFFIVGGGSFFPAIPREFGRAGMNPTMAALCSQLENLALEEGIFQPYEVSESVFAQMAKKDQALLNAFFEGEIDPTLNGPVKLLGDAPTRASHKKRHSRKSSKSSATSAYSRVDKKARKHLARAMDFTRGLEQVLLWNGTFLDCGEVKRTKRHDAEIVQVLLDSAFLRMLAHGIAQFYSIPSRTIKGEDGGHYVRFTLQGDAEERLMFGELSAYLAHLTQNE